MQITQKTNRYMHSLLQDTGLISQKETLIQSFTSNRTCSSKEMAESEARQMISYLGKQPHPKQKMRRKIISMAHEMGWHHLEDGKWVIDMAHLGEWMQKFGYLHKPLNNYSYKELPRLITQFESVYKTFLNNKF